MKRFALALIVSAAAFTAPLALAQTGVSTISPGARITTLVHTASSAGTEATEVQTVTAVGDTAESLAGTWHHLYSALNAKHYYVWFKSGGAGTDPAPAAGLVGLEVDVASGAAASAVAASEAAVVAAANSTHDFSATASGAAVTITNLSPGLTTAASDGTAATGFTFAVGTAGVSGHVAIPPASIQASNLGWRVCNNVANSSTYMAVGKSPTPSMDGVRIAPNACYECPNCTSASLGLIYVSAQAASNAYSVIQFRDQQ